MEAKKMNHDYMIRLDKGEEVIQAITSFCEQEGIRTASVFGLGATDYVKIGLFHTGEKKYHATVLEGPMEITSLVGNVTRKEGEVYLHFHINIADESMIVRGGHLNECRISATCELFLHVLDGEVNRRFDEEIGLNLFQF